MNPPSPILSCGDRVKAGTYSLHTRFERSSLWQSKTGALIFVVEPSIGAGPLNIVVEQPHRFAPDTTLSLSIPSDTPKFNSALPKLDRHAKQRFFTALTEHLPRFAPQNSLISLFIPQKTASAFQKARDSRLKHAFQLIKQGNLPQGIQKIRGTGEGLTPSGDDFLCGWMLACRLHRNLPLARQIYAHATGDNPISNAFLKMALQGRINQPLQNCLLHPTPQTIQRVCQFGHSSGTDLLCGLLHPPKSP